MDPGGVQPLYVRRPDAEVERERGADRACDEHLSRIDRRPASEIDDVLAIEEASFTNPWTREMYLAELENAGVSFCYLARTRTGAAVGSVRSGAWSTSCTSTTWRCCPALAPAGRRDGAADARAARRASGWARAGRRSRCGARTNPPGGCTSASASRWPASGAATTRSRSRTRLCCGASGLADSVRP